MYFWGDDVAGLTEVRGLVLNTFFLKKVTFLRQTFLRDFYSRSKRARLNTKRNRHENQRFLPSRSRIPTKLFEILIRNPPVDEQWAVSGAGVVRPMHATARGCDG